MDFSIKARIIQPKCVYLHRNDAKTTHSGTAVLLADGAFPVSAATLYGSEI